jgi:hypothetical protein
MVDHGGNYMFEFVVRRGKIAVVAGGGKRGRRSLAAVVVAAALAVAAPGALASAQTRIGVNGGRPTEWPILSDILASQGLTKQGWLDFGLRVGENWLPDTKGNSVALDYPGQLGLVSGPGALTTDQSTKLGQKLLHELILDELDKGEPVAVAGISEGTLVIERELAYLQSLSDDEAPSRDVLTFYVFGDMLRGLGQMYLPGVTIPFFGETFHPVPETRYDTVVVNEEWDGWANPPDRPWNPLAVINAVMGAVYTVNGKNDHSQTALDSMDDAVLVSQVTSKTLGGTTSTYVVPRTQLPITRPLLQLGVPRKVVDEIDKMLMPLIRAGYSYMTPNLGPRVDHGQLVFTPPPELPTTTKQLDASAERPAIPAAKTSTDPDETTKVTKVTKHDRSGADGNAKPVAASSVTDTDEATKVSKPDESDATVDDDAPKTVEKSVKKDLKPRTSPRTKPAKVRESTDDEDAPEVRTTVKPSGSVDEKPSGTADKPGTSEGADSAA